MWSWTVTAPVEDPSVDPAQDVAVIIYTRHDCRASEGAMLTHRNLFSNAESVVEAFPMEGDHHHGPSDVPRLCSDGLSTVRVTFGRDGGGGSAIFCRTSSGVIEGEQGTIFMGFLDVRGFGQSSDGSGCGFLAALLCFGRGGDAGGGDEAV